MDHHDEDDSDGRMGIAIGLVSASINAGTATAAFVIGYWLDSMMKPTLEEHSLTTMIGGTQIYVHAGEEDYVAAMRRAMWVLMVIDFVACGIMLIWQLVMAKSLNK